MNMYVRYLFFHFGRKHEWEICQDRQQFDQASRNLPARYSSGWKLSLRTLAYARSGHFACSPTNR